MLSKASREYHEKLQEQYKGHVILKKKDSMFIAYGEDAKVMAYALAIDLYDSEDGLMACALKEKTVKKELEAVKVNYLIYENKRSVPENRWIIKRRGFRHNRYFEFYDVVKDREPNKTAPTKDDTWRLRQLVELKNNRIRSPEWLVPGTKISRKNYGDGVLVERGLMFEAEYENGWSEIFFYPLAIDKGLITFP